MVHTNGRIKTEPLPPLPVVQPAPAWFQVALCSVAVFAGPILLALAIGLVYLASVVAGQSYALFRHSAG